MGGSGRARTGPRVSLYRVIDAAELAYLRTFGNYGSNPSRSGKYFALTLQGAEAFARAPMNIGATITETTLPRTVVDQGYEMMDPGRYGAGPTVHFDEHLLPMVYAAMSAPVIMDSTGQP